jgi:hypothetical protein
MRRQDQKHRPHLQVALLAIGVLLAGVLLADAGEPAGEPATVEVEPTAKQAKRGVRGRIGKPGPRGERGERGEPGRRGVVGDRGPAGTDAPLRVNRQLISIAWQNGNWQGRDRQSFVAPGIGEGTVRCTPPNAAEPNGVQWVRFMPYDNGTATSPPRRWATTMWTERFGGNVDDPNRATTNVTRTARLDRANQTSGFHESMNTAPVGHVPESIGSFDGLITTEPFDPGTMAPPVTTFRLSWHWNFRDSAAARCYVSATFVTEAY